MGTSKGSLVYGEILFGTLAEIIRRQCSLQHGGTFCDIGYLFKINMTRVQFNMILVMLF